LTVEINKWIGIYAACKSRYKIKDTLHIKAGIKEKKRYAACESRYGLAGLLR
jgi:hypothetical protein